MRHVRGPRRTGMADMMKHPLIFFAEEAKRRGYTIKVVGDYSFKKSRRFDSPRIRFIKTLPEGILVTEYHPRTKKSKKITVTGAYQ